MRAARSTGSLDGCTAQLAANLSRKWYPGKRRCEEYKEISINQDQPKDLIKDPLTEVLEEWRELLHEAVEEAFARAIEEGEATEVIEREEVFKLFEGEA